jgi:ABC-type multidrug transport system ATPase subunit
MRQRLGIAQAMAGDPRLIIVDGPTAGLDPEERLRFYRLLSERAADRIVLLSTHIVEDVAVLCPRFAVIRRGRLIAYTTPTEARKTIDGTTFHGHTQSVAFLVFKPLANSVNGVAVSLSGNIVAAAFAKQRAELRAANFGASLATQDLLTELFTAVADKRGPEE